MLTHWFSQSRDSRVPSPVVGVRVQRIKDLCTFSIIKAKGQSLFFAWGHLKHGITNFILCFFSFNLDGEIKADVLNVSICCPLVAKNYDRRTGNKIHEFYFKNNNISI